MRRKESSENNEQEKPTGSPPQGEPLYLVVGQIRKPHGLDGEVFLEIITDFPERLKKGKLVYIGEQYTPLTIAGKRGHSRGLLIHFEGLEKAEDAESLRNELVYAKTEELPSLPAGEYYFHQLLGLDVYDEQGSHLGVLNEILETGANDVYLIKTPEGKEILVPAIDEVVKKTDLKNRKIIISPPEWY